ncbi:MAG: transposase [Deltaproteobacteria bacterium]|nr:transposase [Deltaproteobacteria bacterium]
MPRPHRVIGTDISYHVIARCNNEEFLFKEKEDFRGYLQSLSDAMEQHKFELNSYVLMSNHVHLIVTTRNGCGIDKIIHAAHLPFAKKYNKRRNRKGHFWRDRFKSIVIDDDLYALTCMRYIDRNPLRAGIVKGMGDWLWSSYRFYAFGEPNNLITPLPSYLGLGSHQRKREVIYKMLGCLEAGLRLDEEKKFFSGPLKPGSRQFKGLKEKIVTDLIFEVLRKVPGTF